MMDFEVNAYRMHYGIFGDSAGEPLLWLSGWSGSGEDWKHVFKDVSSGFRLIGPDLRGNGASTGFNGRHTFQQSAHDIFGLLDHLGIHSVKAVGLSGGGITLSCPEPGGRMVAKYARLAAGKHLRRMIRRREAKIYGKRPGQ
jgi:pimeloyl-ACP methyl ester carboxylesterase